MVMRQSQEQAQRLQLTQAMQLTLRLLQLPVAELQTVVDRALVENPMLEQFVPPPPPVHTVSPSVRVAYAGLAGMLPPPEPSADPLGGLRREESYTDHLLSQLGERADLDRRTLSLCRYLVGCLAPSGYLDCPLPELAEEIGAELFELEQALYVVQELDPLGTGARSLAECLLLQLAQSRHFNPLSVRMVSQGLELLAEKDYSRLAALLRADPGAVRRTAQIVRSLNPIPSRGFPSGDDTVYIVPEATVTCEGDSVLIQLNSAGLPSLSIQPYYRSLLEGGEHPEAQEYLRDYLREARDMIAAQENRARTIEKLIIRIVQLQMDHFLSGAPLRAMTMSQLAEGMELSVSTVSRLVKDKYLLFAGAPIPLRSFFTAPVRGEDHALSAEEIRQELRRFIRLEDPAHPLSDEALAASLSGVGIPISRRTVAKYRQEEGIPPAARRKSPAKTKNECEE